MRSLVKIQEAFGILESLQKGDEVAGALSEVWNALLDAHECILHQVLDSKVMGAASLELELRDILKKRQDDRGRCV